MASTPPGPPHRRDPGAPTTIDYSLGAHGEGRVRVTWPTAGRDGRRRLALIHLWTGQRWCLAGKGRYLRGNTRADRGGKHRSIVLIDSAERAIELSWWQGRLLVERRTPGAQLFDPDRSACRSEDRAE